MAGGEEEGEEGNPKAERQKEELSKKLLFWEHRNIHHSMSNNDQFWSKDKQLVVIRPEQ